jgi:hypothetical protein
MTTGRINQVTTLDRPGAGRPWDGRVSSPSGSRRHRTGRLTTEPPGMHGRAGLESPRTTGTERGRRRHAPPGLPRRERSTDTDRSPGPTTDSRSLRRFAGQRPWTHQVPTGQDASRRPSGRSARMLRGQGTPLPCGRRTKSPKPSNGRTGRRERPSSGRATSVGDGPGEPHASIRAFPMHMSGYIVPPNFGTSAPPPKLPSGGRASAAGVVRTGRREPSAGGTHVWAPAVARSTPARPTSRADTDNARSTPASTTLSGALPPKPRNVRHALPATEGPTPPRKGGR